MTILELLENCNDCPNSNQEDTLDSERLLLDSAIANIDKKIALLQIQRANLDAERTRYVIVSSPLRRLPNEILLGIFSELEGQSLWRTSKVCHHWRELVLQTPSFWTDLVLPGPTYQNASTRALKYLIKSHACYYVEHARGLPLSLTITEKIQPIFYAFLADMFGPLHLLGAHWSAISVYSEDACDIDQLLLYYNHYPEEANYLSALTLPALDLVFQDEDDFDQDDEDDVDPVTALDLSNLIALRSLKFNSASLEIWEKPVEVNWSKLTSLSLAHVCDATSQDYLEILKFCDALEDLCVMPEADYHGPAPGPLVTLSHLRKLEITSEDQPSTFLDRLSTPGLQDLILHFRSEVDPEPEDKSLRHFLDRFQGQLRHLVCTGEVFLIGIKDLRNLHNLASLQLISPFDVREDYEDNLFDVLIYDPSKPYEDQLVRLELLEVLEHPPLTLTATNSCAKMLESRSIANEIGDNAKTTLSVLRRVVLIELFDTYVNGREIFSKFREKGILVHN
ncbi:hypothetical protein CPB83DRAFT_843656 [Crepidotus variabilis]|uniref:F-box domain-containing protein n=1 Tax=Crepidotus variabilis TaxID=179855 RepID=A0A9P6JWJ1_9AGAR|nr:hypothetical protein CPB83DRAFT_843656 [Crepidotus variabilis]